MRPDPFVIWAVGGVGDEVTLAMTAPDYFTGSVTLCREFKGREGSRQLGRLISELTRNKLAMDDAIERDENVR